MWSYKKNILWTPRSRKIYTRISKISLGKIIKFIFRIRTVKHWKYLRMEGMIINILIHVFEMLADNYIFYDKLDIITKRYDLMLGYRLVDIFILVHPLIFWHFHIPCQLSQKLCLGRRIMLIKCLFFGKITWFIFYVLNVAWHGLIIVIYHNLCKQHYLSV